MAWKDLEKKQKRSIIIISIIVVFLLAILLTPTEHSKFAGTWHSERNMLKISVDSKEGIRGKCTYVGMTSAGISEGISGDWSGSESGNIITVYLFNTGSFYDPVPSQLKLNGNTLIDENGYHYTKR